MRKAFAEFFESLGIEYFSAIEFSECELINDKLISRIGFEPKTVILFLMPYYAGEPVNLSAYASVSDYHRVFRGIEAKFVDFMKKHAPVSHFCV